MTNLGHVLRRWRLLDELTVREASTQTGIPYATLCRIELGHAIDATTLLKLLNWMMQKRKEPR